jgi:class 3 adenylate cyclase
MQEIDELIRAIIALEAKRTELGDGVVSAAISPLQERLAELEQHERLGQQRRLVTVLFLDIVNSTLLSQGLEPEEVQEVMGGALKRISAPIETYGGEITQFMGDGFVAVFGLTRTRENDARQAVRAALAILMGAHVCAEELAKRYNLKDFQVRLGINTGRVVAGRFSEAESPVMGLTVSLAARMEQAAQPDTAYISQFTYQHVRGAFEFELLPAIEAKGFSKPIEAYRVIAAIPRTFRTFTRGVEGITTSLIGRDGELKQLKEVMTRAFHHQETQLVTITGEAGVGKSRLLYEFDRWIARGPRRVISYKGRASPQMMHVPFGLLRFMISYHLGVLSTDTAQVTRQRLVDEVSVYLTEGCEMKAHFIGSVLGFDFSESPYLRGLEDDPKQLHERGQLYLTQYLSAVAGKSATMIMLDDIHWADKPSLDFIAHLVEECPRLRLMLVCLARPIHDVRPPDWDKEERIGEQALIESLLRQNHLNLDLKPLSRRDSLELLNEILHNVESLPATLRDQILDKAEGNPFYLEEYIQTLIDTKVIRKGQGRGGWGLDFERLDRVELPATLIALLEARLDSLNAIQKEILQQAAVIGRIFWRSTLQSIRGEKHISDVALEALSRHGFIHPLETTTFAGTTEYQFHHVLLRDVAYQALVKSNRQKCRGQVAGWLIGATEKWSIGELPLIAEHYELADIELAADCL